MDFMSIINAALGLAQVIAPIVTDSTKVQSVIDTVEKVTDQIGPAIKAGVNFVEDITPTIAATFAALRNNNATTPEQLAQMDAIEAKLDADYDAASAAAKAEDDAADAAAKPAT